MNNMLHKVCISLFLLFSTLHYHAYAAKIPLKHFSKMPMVSEPTISPNGEHIAVMLNQGEFTQIAIVKFADPNDLQVILQLGAEKYRIENFIWGNNHRVLVEVSQPYRVNGRNVRTNHLYSASLDGKNVLELRKKSRLQSARDFYLNSPSLLSVLPKDYQHVLVTSSDQRDNNYSSVFKVNIETGEFTKYLPNSLRIIDWIPDRNGEILFAIGVDRDPNKSIYYYYTRQSVKDKWTLVKQIESYKDQIFLPRIFEVETQSLIVISDHLAEGEDIVQRSRLWRYSIKKAQFTELLGEAPSPHDVTDVISQRVGDRVELIGFNYNDGYVQYHYFDKNNAKLAQQVRGVFAKRDVEAFLYDWDEKRQRYLILTVSDRKPPTYYTFDQAKGALHPWYGAYPELSKAGLASVKRYDFQARDGRYLHGYLTLPNGVKQPPVVLFPHGGPYGVYDSKYFNSFVQMFASRGYAVVQVNYRGSGAYGNDYLTAGYGEWGKKMQTDLLDAMDYVISIGKVAKDQACIVGASYGGYAALTAGYQTPDRFQCIVSIAGISDMVKQVRDFRKRGFRAYIDNAITDKNMDLKQISPINFVENFKAPVLLIHGKVDRRVDYRQSEDMYQALKKAGKSVEYELFEYGTHNLNDAGNRIRAMEMLEAFLEEHLSP